MTMTKRRTKKYLAARVLCTLLLGTYLVGGYGEPVAWGADNEGTAKVAGVENDFHGIVASAWGAGTKAYGRNSTSFGANTVADGHGATAFGGSSMALGFCNTAWGYATQAGQLLYGSDKKVAYIVDYKEGETTKYKIVDYNSEEKKTLKDGFNSYWDAYSECEVKDVDQATAWGSGAKATDWHATAFGFETIASGKRSTAFGQKSEASGESATAWGGYFDGNVYKGGTASGTASTAFGIETAASGFASTAWGEGTIASGSSSTAFGAMTEAIGDRSTAFGFGTQAGQLLYGSGANQKEATIERYTKDGETKYRIVNASDWSDILDNNEGTGFASYEDAFKAEGLTKTGHRATAFGQSTRATGDASTAFGISTTASGTASTAFGYDSTASGAASTAFGLDTTASGDYSTAFGTSSLAYGRDSTAFGNMSKASGVDSTAFGAVTEAIGDRSTAFGYGTQAGRLLYGEDKTEALIRRYKDGDIYKYKIVDANNTSTTLKEGFASYEAAIKAEGLTKTGDRATAFGQSTKATGLDSTAFGWETTASGDGSTAFGQKSTASGYYSTAFGYNTTAGGHYSAAWGSNSVASGSSSTAFGISSEAKAKNSLAALGGIVETGGENSAAIGKGAKVTVADAVALGSGSVADTANTISVGSSSLQRKIVNVAAGTADTDAVNLKQLSDKLDKTEFNTYKEETAATLGLMQNAITQNADDISDLQTNKLDKAVYEADKADTKAALDGKANVALDNITEDGKTVIKDLAKGAVNVVGDGPVSVAKSDVSGVDTYTVSVKTDGKVEDSNTGIVTGGTVYDYLHGDTVELGKGSKATGTQSIAIGFGNKVSGNNSGAIGDPNTVEGDNSWAFGNNNQIPGSNSIVLGNKNNVSGSNTFVLGNNVKTSASNAVVLGDGSEGVDGAVSVGSKDKKRQIKNVADGTDDSDAATFGQLKELAGGTGAGLEEVTHRISNVDSKVNKVGAGAAALAALHPLDTDNKFTMAAGFGNYRNANAMALGMFYRPTDKVMFSVGGAMGNGENMINAGVSFALDKGVGTSKAAMARTIKAQGDRIAEQDAKIQSLEAYNAKLEERLAALEAKIGK